MTDQARIIPQVELMVFVQDGGGTTPATILIEGSPPGRGRGGYRDTQPRLHLSPPTRRK